VEAWRQQRGTGRDAQRALPDHECRIELGGCQWLMGFVLTPIW